MFKELSSEQRRQFIDISMAFEALEGSRSELSHRFSGSMRWVKRGGGSYLLRKQGRVEKSLGARSPETEQAYDAFERGRAVERERAQATRARLADIARVNKALRLARVPDITARILRHLASGGVLGRNVFVVGTNCLFLYEAMAGVQFTSDLVATGDVDLLLDARRNLRLAVHDFREEGVLGYLKRADRSFERSRAGEYRAVNKNGFMVDLICPERDVLAGKADALTDGDLIGVGLHGMEWLINAPKVDGIVIGEDGLPFRMWTVDPRVFSLHKFWLSKRDDREPVKRYRDVHQARVVARIARDYLGLKFNDPALAALPAIIRDRGDELMARVETKGD